jgi:thymidylate synthase
MNNIDKQYQKLLQDIIDNGVEKKDRTGTGTISVFGRQIRHKMSEGFPLLTTKKMAWKTMVTELLWFLRGDTNIKFLVDNGCHIWDGDAYKNYLKNHKDKLIGCTIVLSNGVSAEIIAQHNVNRNVLITDKGRINIEGDDTIKILNDTLTQEEFINKIKTDDEFANRWGELGPIYGSQWRDWGSEVEFGQGESVLYGGVDQITNLINDLKTNPDSRRLMVNAWNVGELDQMVLPPCHYGFQVYTRELSLEERLDLAAKTYDVFDPLDFGIPAKVDHDEINKMYPIPKRAISLMWNQRSVDTFLGLPFNIASYGLLLEIIAKVVNMVPDELIGNLGDVHLYSNHIEQAKEQIGRRYTFEEREEMLKNAMGPKGYRDALNDLAPFGGGMSEYYEIYKIPNRTRQPFQLPKLVHGKTDEFYKSLSESTSLFGHLNTEDFSVEGYQSHPTIKAPLSN